MSEATPPEPESDRAAGRIAPFPLSRAAATPVVHFDRRELTAIMDLYGRMVSAGEWRDYAIDFLADRAVFSIYRRASEVPLYRVVKDPALARRQGAYAVVGASGLIMKRGHDLDKVLRVLDRPVLVLV